MRNPNDMLDRGGMHGLVLLGLRGMVLQVDSLTC